MPTISTARLHPPHRNCRALQAWGPPKNGALRKLLENAWLASTVSSRPIVAVFLIAVVR